VTNRDCLIRTFNQRSALPFYDNLAIRRFVPSRALGFWQTQLMRLESCAYGFRKRRVGLQRGQIQCLLELWNGFISLPLLAQRETKIFLGFSVIRFELERPLEVWNGFLPLALLGQRDT